MKFKILLRPALAVTFGFIGAIIARGGTPPDIFAISGRYFLIVAFLAFATLGFILPDLIELAGRAGIAALARQIAEFLPKSRARFTFRRRNKSSSRYQNPLVVDTSALVDGRLFDIVKTGFIFGTFLILPSVVDELHRLADSSDELKRARGRKGLDGLEVLQKDKNIKVEVLSSEPKEKSVDDKLVKAARQIKAKIVTVDFNLNKVAKVKGLSVLNLNELTNAVKTVVLPGERLAIQVNGRGKEKDQGVGYLQDGTMVVVEGGVEFVGRTIEVVVLRVLQTVAGKMIFARISNF